MYKSESESISKSNTPSNVTNFINSDGTINNDSVLKHKNNNNNASDYNTKLSKLNNVKK